MKGRSICIQDLSFQYKGVSSPYVLQDVNVTIPEGKITAIVGTSGSGKTTLLKLLLKIYNVEQGRIVVGDTNLKQLNTADWRSTCGVVMQDGFIFNDTILRNITESDSLNPLDKDKLQRAVHISNLATFIEELPAGYNTVLGNQGAGISGGQKQRLLLELYA